MAKDLTQIITESSQSTWIYTPTLQGSYNPAEITTDISGITFNSTGSKMFLCYRGTQQIFQYSLSTAYDITSASYDSVSVTLSEGTTLEQIAFNTDGTKLYTAMNGGDTMYQYTCSGAYAISGLSYDSKSKSASDTNLSGITFGGTRIIVSCDGSDNLKEFLLSDLNDISTATNPYSFDFNPPFANIENVFYVNNGKNILCVDAGNNYIWNIYLPTAYSLNGASVVGNIVLTNNIRGIYSISNNIYVTATDGLVYWYKLL